jgi:hypothetical protein
MWEHSPRPRLGGGVVNRSSPESVKAQRTQHNPATCGSLLILLCRYSAYNQFWSATPYVVSHLSAGNLQVSLPIIQPGSRGRSTRNIPSSNTTFTLQSLPARATSPSRPIAYKAALIFLI